MQRLAYSFVVQVAWLPPSALRHIVVTLAQRGEIAESGRLGLHVTQMSTEYRSIGYVLVCESGDIRICPMSLAPSWTIALLLQLVSNSILSATDPRSGAGQDEEAPAVKLRPASRWVYCSAT